MLSAAKLKKFCKQRQIGVEQLAEQIVRGGLDSREAADAIRYCKKGLFIPLPRPDDVRHLAAALYV